MRRLLTPFLLSLAVGAPAANLPLKLNFQGRLIDPATSVPKDGVFSMTFRVYDAASGGSALYTETQSAVPVSNGVFSVQLGSAAALSPDLFAGASAYLSVQVSPDAEMSPRQQLVMSPYAMTAAQLVGDAAVRVRVGAVSYSTFTSGGNLLLMSGVSASTGVFSATGNAVYSVSASSGILSSAGTVRVLGAGGVHADYGVRAGSVTAVSFFQSGTPAATPAVSPSGSLRAYYDATEDDWRVSVNGRAYSPLATMSLTLWNTNATAVVGNQGQNLPTALTEFDRTVQGTRMQIDCDDLPARLALRYNFRSSAATSLTIGISVRDVTNTSNILVSASQSVNATQTWLGQGSFATKPGWCTGTQTVAVYTDGGNGTWDAIFKHIVLVGKP
ncbi:MAG: hypothetical protein SF051_15620 [Elusimicrobiota bacterium]|nr:hypothetical protein [Elusimicrobiota bacterium]